MAGLGKVTFEPRLRKKKLYASNTVYIALTGGQSYHSKHEDTEPIQHRYSASAATVAGTGGRVKKDTEKSEVTKHLNALFMKSRAINSAVLKGQKVILSGVNSFKRNIYTCNNFSSTFSVQV